MSLKLLCFCAEYTQCI